MVNPYTIDMSGGNQYAGLSGLADTITRGKLIKSKEAEAQAQTDQATAARQEISDAMATNDPMKIRAIMAKYPEAAKGLKAAIETKFPGESGNALKNAYFNAAISPGNVAGAIQGLKSVMEQDGLDPQEIAKLDAYQKMADDNPGEFQKTIVGEFAAMTAGEDSGGYWDRYQDITGGKEPGKPTATIQEYNLAKEQGYNKSFVEYKKDFGRQSTTSGKTYSKKNPDGSTRTIPNVIPGSEQESQLIEAGFLEGSQTVGAKMTSRERADKKTMDNVGKLSAMANKDPNSFYENENYRMNDDGSLYLDPVTDMPVKMKSFYDATGKRGVPKAIMELGEQWDDAKELLELLELPSVQASLKKAKTDGLWDKVAGKWNNKIQKWMQDQGIKGDSPTATAIARTQRMASDERKRFMGTAVTENEQISSLAWMPSAGDSYESMINKTTLMAKESEQMFRRYIDVFGKDADMSPFYKAFGIKRFVAEPSEQKDQPSSDKTDEDLIKSLGL